MNDITYSSCFGLVLKQQRGMTLLYQRIDMKIENIPISLIKPYQQNNRVHSEQQVTRIAESIKSFGFNQPIVIDENNEILVGHGRLYAAQLLKLKEVPIVYIKGLAEKDKRAYRILDNKLQNDSTWDFDSLASEFDYLIDQGFDLEKWGLDNLKDLMLGEVDEPEVVEDDFEAEELDKIETVIKYGDQIQFGKHRLLCGNCLNTQEYSWPNVDVIFTSPPYNRGSSVKLANKSVGESSYQSTPDNMDQDEYCEFLGKFLRRMLKIGKVIAINLQILAGNKVAVLDWLHEFGDHFVDVFIWNKRLAAPAAAKNVVNTNHEFVFLFSPKDAPSRAIETASFHGTKNSVINIDPQHSNEFSDIHAATMPVKFAGECLEILGGLIIFDPFMGTGTTLIAADQLGRICYGMEIEPKYCQVIVDRYKAYCEKSGKPFECKINGKTWP
jgi:DNA modification methylase